MIFGSTLYVMVITWFAVGVTLALRRLLPTLLTVFGVFLLLSMIRVNIRVSDGWPLTLRRKTLVPLPGHGGSQHTDQFRTGTAGACPTPA